MMRKAVITAVAMTAALWVTVGAAGAALGASAISLVVPQSTAFSVLGHSCGGIQEQAFATGFDATSDFPTGDVYLSTRCGGSGRGGGYHTTTYSAWVGATWDLTGALVSSAKLSAAPMVDPTLSAFDQYGNEVYNQSNGAYLLLAPGFVPAPRVTGIAPTLGPAAGGTTVAITGTGLTGTTGVAFGTTAATSFTVNGDTSITAVSPAAGGGTVDVTVTTAGGTSAASSADQFTFIAAPTVSGLSPNNGAVDGGTMVTITGTNFIDVTAVNFGDTPAGFTVNDDSSITAMSPVAEAPDTVRVTVVNVGGTSAASPADEFSYTTSPPTATAAIDATATPTATTVPTGTPMPGVVVSGQVAYYGNGLPVSGVDVHLDGAASQVASTDSSGGFAFSGLGETDWTLTPQYQGGIGAAISALDAVYALEAAVGSRPLGFAQGLACDTSGNGTVSAYDAVLILQYVVGLIQSFPVTQQCGSDWAFVPVPASATNQQLIQPGIVQGNCQQGAIALQPLVGDAGSQDFSAVLFGDCTGSWQPNPSGAAATLTSSLPTTAMARVGAVERGRSGRVRFPLLVESVQPFQALDFRVSYDATSLRLAAARPVNTARNALIAYNPNTPGVIAIALASAQPISSDGGTVIVLDFEPGTSRRLAPPHILTAAVDARSAGVVTGD